MKKSSARAGRSLAIFLALASTSCSGPYTPFGPINLLSLKSEPALPHTPAITREKASNGVQFEFVPDRLVLHGPMKLAFRLTSATPLAADATFRVLYNGKDVTDGLQSDLKVQKNDKGTVWNVLVDRTLHFPPGAGHDVRVVFYPAPGAPGETHQLLAPRCELRSITPLRTMDEFESEWPFLNRIEKMAQDKKLNPSFLAGLIASKTNLDKKTVGPQGELGPAQLPHQVARQVEAGRPAWPRSYRLMGVHPALSRAMLATGIADLASDWQFDEEKSLIGALEYLEGLDAFWSKPENRQKLEQFQIDSPSDYTDVVFASYEHGPAKVLAHIQLYGPKWMEARDFELTKSQDERMRSYCYHFSRAKEKVEP